jgi:hypothetical protein
MRISWMRTVKPLRFLFRGARISAALSERVELYTKIARPCGRCEPRAAARRFRRRLHTELYLTAPNRGHPCSAAFSQAGLRPGCRLRNQYCGVLSPDEASEPAEPAPGVTTTGVAAAAGAAALR